MASQAASGPRLMSGPVRWKYQALQVQSASSIPAQAAADRSFFFYPPALATLGATVTRKDSGPPLAWQRGARETEEGRKWKRRERKRRRNFAEMGERNRPTRDESWKQCQSR
eukprot:2656068-Rhodomonas_salina.3